MTKNNKTAVIFYLILVFFMPLSLLGQSVVNSAHNLSANSSGKYKAQTESEICIFCHTPHSAKAIAPLWNRANSGTVYQLYNSSTFDAVPGQPDGSSILCLSCHDGTIALGNISSRPYIEFNNGVTMLPSGRSNLSTDLSDDHPISFVYDNALSVKDKEIKNPSDLIYPVRLEKLKLQCVSCHDPHKNMYNNFLLVTNQSSDLCLVCHEKSQWIASTHQTSNKTWNGNGPNPWFHTEFKTVSTNGCESCHNPHNAGGRERLLKYNAEEDNCLDCHNGNVAAANIQQQFVKTYRHNVSGYTGIHDPTEIGIPSQKHVECVDCHNSHAINGNEAVAPNVKGYNIGVQGISQNGTVVKSASFEYEICYRCHSQNAVTPSSVTRLVAQNNVLLEFDPANYSYHPIAAPGKNNNVPSLISPYTVSSMIYCSDCHGSDGTNAPGGPHGSIYPQILIANYNRASNSPESITSYALCYNCHDRNSILSNQSFPYHNKHIREENTSCIACHDSHGISSSQTSASSGTHLINFNTGAGFVTPANGIIRFTDNGVNHGSCQLTCHGETHNPESY
jgi:predicted CXXCH cytochrome family protein